MDDGDDGNNRPAGASGRQFVPDSSTPDSSDGAHPASVMVSQNSVHSVQPPVHHSHRLPILLTGSSSSATSDSDLVTNLSSPEADSDVLTNLASPEAHPPMMINTAPDYRPRVYDPCMDIARGCVPPGLPVRATARLDISTPRRCASEEITDHDSDSSHSECPGLKTASDRESPPTSPSSVAEPVCDWIPAEAPLGHTHAEIDQSLFVGCHILRAFQQFDPFNAQFAENKDNN